MPLEAGGAARVVFRVPADVTAFTGLDGRKVVEPGEARLHVSRSSANAHATVDLRLTGPLREVDHTRRWTTDVVVSAVEQEVVGA